MASRSYKQAAQYSGVLAGCFAAALLAGSNPLSDRIDNYAYDWMSSAPSPAGVQSVIVELDPETFKNRGGVPETRKILSEALDRIDEAGAKVVALDITLDDATKESDDARLEASMRATGNLVLAAHIDRDKWQLPIARFKDRAAELGHVHVENDGVARRISLSASTQGQRYWALSLVAFHLFRGQPIEETSFVGDLRVGDTLIPTTNAEGRPMWIRYLPKDSIPAVSVLEAGRHPEMIRGKVVFLGITALDAARDRVVIPDGRTIPGIEVHAQAFETMARGQFLTPAHNITETCLAFTLGIGLAFAFLPIRGAYLLTAALLALASSFPVWLFHHDVVFPYFRPVAVAWLSAAGAATYQHFFVRRQLRRSESEKSRYQQAIHWAAHEMRTPLTSIQGSSEIMTRYNLPEEKRHQLSEMINSESKRLSRIIQTFLDVERLAEGQMELKREPFAASAIVDTCIQRVKPIAERKQIEISLDTPVEGTVSGDRELMEYAFYNLLTNAVKYSPSKTHVSVSSFLEDGEMRLSVQDQGMGMDTKELKNIFKKFYRTKRAEASGEVGTGIGLSIVLQIVTHHGGRIDVTSEPGKGSCFTIVLRANG